MNATRPFASYIRSSIDLFAALHPRLQLAGMAPIEEATLFEVFPGAEWRVFSGQALPKKGSIAGRTTRRSLFTSLGVSGLPQQPTADQNDAVAGAYLAWCTRHKPNTVALEGVPPFPGNEELREGYILHAAAGPVTAVVEALAPLSPERRVSSPPEAAPAAVPDEEWSGDDELAVRLNDTGLVHGNDPENAWLRGLEVRFFETVAPHPRVHFSLLNRIQAGSWRVSPTIPDLLAQLEIRPPILSRRDAVTLRVRVV